MKLKKNELALEIRDWTHDIKAEKKFWPFRAMKVCGILGALGFLSAIVLGILVIRAGWPMFVTMIAVVVGFALLILAGLFKTVIARKATLLCSKCQQPMTFQELNYPSDSPQLALGTTYEAMTMREIIEGENGRIYALYNDLRHKGNSQDGRQAARLMQGVRMCNHCERFILSQRMSFKKLGSKRKHIEAAEEKAKNTDT